MTTLAAMNAGNGNDGSIRCFDKSQSGEPGHIGRARAISNRFGNCGPRNAACMQVGGYRNFLIR
jgi:hypothetical protein